MDFADYANVMVGVAEGIMIIDGIVFCETCWKTKLGPEDCSCVDEMAVACDLCIDPPPDSRTPCASCFPERFENWTAAMAALEEIMGPYREMEEEEEEGPEEGICENCFGSYKNVLREQPPCHFCSPAFKDAWTRARYGTLSCDTCKTVYSADATVVCSACHPQFIEDCCGPQDQDNNDRYSHEYCRTYGV